jgi:asparagine synthase (glutamine-hydrolysing)
MCGISGFNWEDKKVIKRMNKLLSHRGPDGHGYYTDKFVSLGHVRLAIIDLSKAGKQPMCNEDGTIWITYNGELYNFKPLKTKLEAAGHEFNSNTDTEVILHSYEEWGVDCIKRFNGMFSFCIYDLNTKNLFLVRDRIGIKPLYYYFDNGKFIFASEIKAILEHKAIRKEINFDALNRYFMLRYIPGEETIFKRISKLPPGYYLKFNLKSKSLRIEQYWDFHTSPRSYLSNSESKKLIRKLLKDSVNKRLLSDVPLGVFLSGGIDSSAVVALMRRLNKENSIKTFSVGFERGELVNELNYAHKVAECFNTDHKEYTINSDVIKLLPKIIWHLDEPMSDPATIPNYFLSHYAKKDVSVILTGDGADELFGGYDQYKFLSWGKVMSKVPYSNKCVSGLIRHTPTKLLNRVYKYSSVTGEKMFVRFSKFADAIKRNDAKAYLEIMSIFDEDERKRLLSSEALSLIKDFTNYDAINRRYFQNKGKFLNKVIRFDLKRYLPDDLLIKPDRMGMAHGMEIRVPFLDHRLINLSFKISPSQKIRRTVTKYVLKKSLNGILPEKIINRKKQTFQLPIHEWIEKDLRGTFEDFLLEENREQKIFNFNYIRKIFEKHNKSKLFYSRQLWNLINFQIWYNMFIKNENVKI